jgi:hypothetical protein
MLYPAELRGRRIEYYGRAARVTRPSAALLDRMMFA